MTPSKSLRLGRFRSVARDILANDREARRFGAAVDTSGAIARALERAYQEGVKQASADPAEPSGTEAQPLQWAEIPRRAADLLEVALPRASYDHESKTATLDLDQTTGFFLAAGTGSNARYRVVWTGPRRGGRPYIAERSFSPRFFQILLRMGLVTADEHPDGQTILEPTSTAITAYIDYAEELARKAGYRFRVVVPE